MAKLTSVVGPQQREDSTGEDGILRRDGAKDDFARVHTPIRTVSARKQLPSPGEVELGGSASEQEGSIGCEGPNPSL